MLSQIIELAKQHKIEIIVPVVEGDDLFKEVQTYNKSKTKDPTIKLQVGTHINNLQTSKFQLSLKVSHVDPS